MKTILHISDTHFGTVVNDVSAALLSLVQQQQPDIALLSGDITQRARRAQFAAAQAFVSNFPCRVLTVPGNHDIPLFNLAARFLNPYGNYRAGFGEELEPEYEDEELLVIGVNTTRAARHKDGEVSAAQIRRVAERLHQSLPEQLRVVMQHHPVRAVEEDDVENLLIGREKAVPAWAEAGMDLLLAGHIHLPYVRPVMGSTAWTAQAGTALSSRTRGSVPNSLNIIRYPAYCDESQGIGRTAKFCLLERWDYSRDSRSFTAVDCHELQLTR